MSDEQTQDPTEEKKSEELEQEPGQKLPEKTLTQTEVNKLMAAERRKYEADYKILFSDFNNFKNEIKEKEQVANDAAAEKVEALRKDIPESVTKLLDKLTPIEQLEWLNDPENQITKKEIPPLPRAEDGHGRTRKTLNII